MLKALTFVEKTRKHARELELRREIASRMATSN
jgi:hypothetical protein